MTRSLIDSRSFCCVAHAVVSYFAVITAYVYSIVCCIVHKCDVLPSWGYY